MIDKLSIEVKAPKFIEDEKGELAGQILLSAGSDLEIDRLIVGLDALFPYPEKEKFNQKRALRVGEEVAATAILLASGETKEIPFAIPYKLKAKEKKDPMFQKTGKWGEKMQSINEYMVHSGAKYQLVIRIKLADGTTFREYVQMRFA